MDKYVRKIDHEVEFHKKVKLKSVEETTEDLDLLLREEDGTVVKRSFESFTFPTYFKQNNFGNFNGGISDVAYDPNLDRIYVVGVFTEYKGLPAPGIIRLMPDGEIDPEFVVGTGFSGGNIGSIFTRTQRTIWVLSDSTVFIGGGFTVYNGTTVNRIVKLLPNGSIDTSFASGTAITGFSLTMVSSLYVDEAEEKVVLVGLFSTWNGNSSVRDCVIKVGFDGVLDTTFSIGTGASSSGTNVISIAEIDGSYFISGFFLNYGGSSAPRIARINKTTGAFESSFVSQAQGGGTHIDHYITPYLGKILLTGGFVTYAGQDKRRIVLLNLDGSIDTSFNVEPGFARLNNAIDNFNTSAYLVRPYVEDNNTILIPVVESLQQYNGRPISNIVRLSTTGELLNNYGYENAPKYLITKIGSTYYAYSIPAFDPLGHGVNSFSPLNSNFVAQFEYKGYIQDENGHITSSSNLETTEAQTQSNFITRRDARGLIKSFFHNFTIMYNRALRLFDFTKASIETEPEHYVAIKNGEIIKTAIPSPPTLPTNTSDLINDGEDGVNPFTDVLDFPEAEPITDATWTLDGDGLNQTNVFENAVVITIPNDVTPTKKVPKKASLLSFVSTGTINYPTTDGLSTLAVTAGALVYVERRNVGNEWIVKRVDNIATPTPTLQEAYDAEVPPTEPITSLIGVNGDGDVVKQAVSNLPKPTLDQVLEQGDIAFNKKIRFTNFLETLEIDRQGFRKTSTVGTDILFVPPGLSNGTYILLTRQELINADSEANPESIITVKDYGSPDGIRIRKTQISATWSGTVIPMDKIFGVKNNTPSWNATYTLGTIVDGASAMGVIDTTGQTVFPSITGADLLDGSDFEPNAIFEMYVYVVGTDVRYYFLYIKPA
jgi:hypothetical protein